MLNLRRERRGFTLVEAFITTAIASLFMATAFTFLNATRRASEFNDAPLKAEEYANVATDKIVSELRLGNPLTVVPATGNYIQFQVPMRENNGEFMYEPDPIDNAKLNPNLLLVWGCGGSDQSKVNGFIKYEVDLGKNSLVRVELDESGGVIRSDDVASNIVGASFIKSGENENTTIQVSITAQVSGTYGAVSHTVTTKVKLRNCPPTY